MLLFFSAHSTIIIILYTEHGHVIKCQTFIPSFFEYQILKNLPFILS